MSSPPPMNSPLMKPWVGASGYRWFSEKTCDGLLFSTIYPMKSATCLMLGSWMNHLTCKASGRLSEINNQNFIWYHHISSDTFFFHTYSQMSIVAFGSISQSIAPLAHSCPHSSWPGHSFLTETGWYLDDILAVLAAIAPRWGISRTHFCHQGSLQVSTSTRVGWIRFETCLFQVSSKEPLGIPERP